MATVARVPRSPYWIARFWIIKNGKWVIRNRSTRTTDYFLAMFTAKEWELVARRESLGEIVSDEEDDALNERLDREAERLGATFVSPQWRPGDVPEVKTWKEW